MTAMEALPALSPAQIVEAGRPLMKPLQALTSGFALEVINDAAEPSVNRIRDRTSHSGTDQFRQGFRIGDLRLMMRFEDGSELTEMPELYRLPNAPDWFCGLANLHGMLTPVFDLSRYLGIGRDASTKRMLLILSHGSDAAGILIDGLPVRLRWAEEQQRDTSTAPERLAPLLRGTCLAEDSLWFDLDVVSLLNVLEQALEASA